MQAASVMEERPDSALALLDSISDPGEMNRSDQAEYALLLTQARDKNYIPHTGDSLIRMAVSYYENKKDKLRKARSYFYLGSVYRDMENEVAAIDAFLKALDAMPAEGEKRLSYLIYYNLSTQYKSQDFYQKAMGMSRKAYDISVERIDFRDMIYPLRQMAQLFLFLNTPDSALAYYNKALSLSRLTSDSVQIPGLLNDMSFVYDKMGDYMKADQYITEAMKYTQKPAKAFSYYLQKGNILSHLNKPDSAYYYLLQSVESDNIFLRASGFMSLYALAKATGDYQKATEFNDAYAVLRDSVTLKKRRTEIVKLMNKQAVAVQTKELEAKKEREKYYVIIGFLCLIGVCTGVFVAIAKHKEKRISRLEEELKLNRVKAIRMDENLADNQDHLLNRADDLRRFRGLLGQNIQLCIRLFREEDMYRKMCRIEKQLNAGKNVTVTTQQREAIINSICQVFPPVIIDLKKLYGLTSDDSYYCILSLLGFSKTTIITCMMISDNTFRTRKSRIKKKLDDEANLFFESFLSDGQTVNKQ